MKASEVNIINGRRVNQIEPNGFPAEKKFMVKRGLRAYPNEVMSLTWPFPTYKPLSKYIPKKARKGKEA
ncbi:MAG: hypothetical protein JRN68_03555 [Nitrososphaerota archaeon]|nr:hypothetical protein [Nitrososphaerota archaeon]